ncbi:hypothetical protein H8E07_20210 [bacterium]|nr:hypothetical protein [bacterium]
MYWLLGITIAFVAILLLEELRLRQTRRRIPLRIVVTGTRGKSSLVRILAAGLRDREPATWGKITGDAPLLLTSDHMSVPIPRRGPARIHEQRNLLFGAAGHGIRRLVLESMAISPTIMKAEMRLIQPSLVVITNVFDDHRETLGGDRNRQRAAYLEALPADCRWLSADAELLDAAARSERYPEPLAVTTRPEGPDGDEAGVACELLNLADAALAELGLDTESAHAAMRAAAVGTVPPPRIVPFLDRRVRLLDGFSANDLQSLDRLWRDWRRLLDDPVPWPVLFATRADRPLRTQQFCGWLAGRSDVAHVYVAGSHRTVAAWLLSRRGVPVSVVVEDPLAGGTESTGEIVTTDTEPEILVGVGNALGFGMQLRETAQAAEA